MVDFFRPRVSSLFTSIVVKRSRMGTLLPWNFFITPYQYWIDKLDDSSSTPNQTVCAMIV